jgi:cell division protein FtsQ
LSRKKTIRKIAVISACLLAGGGMASLLLAANGKEAAHYCHSIDVTIHGGGEKAYISKSDILSSLHRAAKDSILHKRIETINVARLEKALEQHPWIGDAELYFDTHDVLHVAVTEREPVARVFTSAGNTFYMDSFGQRLPLLPDVNVRVPVITAFSNAKKHNAKDSAVVKDVTRIATYIAHHPFWNAQIAQIDITSSGTFELVPVVGNHIIRIGRADNLDEKLSNLLLFYKQVLSKTGFDNYAVVDVQYKDQVIGSHERTSTTVDSVQLQRNIQELMRRAKQQAEADSIAAVEEATAALDTVQQKPPVIQPMPEQTQTVPATSNLPVTKPVKTAPRNNTKNPGLRKPTPKAVMKKRTVG